MKMQPDTAHGPTITGYGSGWVEVNGERFHHALLVDARTGTRPWNCARFEELDASHFAQATQDAPELLIFGSGDRIRFAHPSLLADLYARRIGVETMDTAAACRTFNFLAGEGRRVVAALLLPG